MKTKLLVGCPLAGRDWIIEKWFDHIYDSCPSDIDLSFLFLVPSWDTKTLNVICNKKNVTLILNNEPVREDKRRWTDEGIYNFMSEIRNKTLANVRRIFPDFYLSVDSDILLAKDTITDLLETLHTFNANAVGGATYLDPTDKTCSNAAYWRDPNRYIGFKRAKVEGVQVVDILMAVKLMDRLAYNINYEFHQYGEDFGWSKNLKIAGGKAMFDSRSPSKHIMNSQEIDRIDKRIGW